MTAKLLSRTGVALIAAGICIAVPKLSWAKMFKYTDESGSLHVVDDIDKVPAKYRDGVKVRESSVSSEPVAPAAPAVAGDKAAEAKPADGAAPAPDAKGGKDDKKKGPVDKNGNDETYWKTRLDRCSQEVASLNSRVGDLEANAGTGNDAGAAEVTRQIMETRNKLEAKKKECGNLREEGRRAGAPAGWLR